MANKLIKFFIFLIVLFTLSSGLFDKFLPSFASISGLLGLSYWGMHHFFLWQPLTYLFVYPSPHGLDPGTFLNLFFNMFMLYRLGQMITEFRGLKHFLYLFFGSGLAASLTALCFLFAYPTPLLFAGTAPALFGLVVSSIILYPEMQFLLFLTFPVRAKWLVAGVLSALLLIDLSNGYFLSFATNFAACLFAYLYSIIVWQQKGPFAPLHRLEEFLIDLPSLFRSKPSSTISPSSSKIYDFRTGQQILNDEAFVNNCLDKISRSGKSSLTWKERFRLNRISKRQKQKDLSKP